MEKTRRTRPSKSVTFTLNPKNPTEHALIKILEEKRSVRTSSHRYAYGTELIRELVLLGVDLVEQRYQGQIILNKFPVEKVSTRKEDLAFAPTVAPVGRSDDFAGTVPLE